MSETIYEVKNLGFSYAKSEDALLFDDLSLDVKKGESLVILGPSGEGKSTLLKIMAGLIKPDAGEVRFQGVSLFGSTRKEVTIIRRRIAMTFQKGGLFDSLTCGENLRLPLREAWRLKEKILNQKVDKALKEVRLSDVEELMVHEISGGMQKRLGIARALVLAPEIVLYDEPTAGLDPVTSRQIMDLILEVKKRHQMTIITVTSDIARAYQAADRIAFMHEGKIVQEGTPDSFRESVHPVVHRFMRGIAEQGRND